jgi:biopolymer transport protein ExbD
VKITRSKQIKSYIPTASMADITFMLIIFFVLTTTFTVDKTTVALPDSLNRAEAAQESALVLIHIERNLPGKPWQMEFRYSEGMNKAWDVGEAIPVGNPPDFDMAYAAVRANIIPLLNRDVRCTLQPQDNLRNLDGSDAGTPCYEYMRQVSRGKYPRPNTKVFNDMLKTLPTKRFIIKADRDIPYRFVDPVIQVFRDNSAYEVFLLTEEKPFG